jgi:hypothetical protein
MKLSTALFLSFLMTGCAMSTEPEPPSGTSTATSTATEKSTSAATPETTESKAEAVQAKGENPELFGYWWTCQAHGRAEAGIWVSPYGYGPDYASARNAALSSCNQVASGCYILGCHPGL